VNGIAKFIDHGGTGNTLGSEWRDERRVDHAPIKCSDAQDEVRLALSPSVYLGIRLLTKMTKSKNKMEWT